MTVVGWIFIGYGVIALLLLRPVAGHFAFGFLEGARRQYPATMRGRTQPDGAQWTGGLVLATLVVAAWPVAVMFFLVGSQMPALGAERRALVVQQEKRIQELERELELTR